MKASVVIPVYNDPDRILQCLNALNDQQTMYDFEVIVSDDGSTDDTYETTAKWCCDKPRFQVMRNDHHGPAYARNSGVKKSVGEIILFTDADCIPSSDWIQNNVQYFEEHPDISAVKGVYRTKQSSVVARLCQIEFETRYNELSKHITTDFVDTYSAGIRRHAFESIDGFDCSYKTANNEDVDLSFRLYKAGYKIGFSRHIQVHHTHPASWLKYFITKFWRAFYRMKVYAAHTDKIQKDSYTPFAMKFQILFFPLFICALFSKKFRVTASAVLLCSMIPFLQTALKYDRYTIMFVPLFIIVRTSAFVAGIAYGIKENWR